MHEHWAKSSGRFNEISEPIDDLLLAKYNVERVLTILTDYRDLDSDVERNKQLLEENADPQLLQVYKDLRTMNAVRMRLIERVNNNEPQTTLLSLQSSMSTFKKAKTSVPSADKNLNSKLNKIQGDFKGLRDI